jgi:hypothetical protein
MRTKDDFCGLEKKSAKDDSPAPVLFRYFIRRKKLILAFFFALQIFHLRAFIFLI